MRVNRAAVFGVLCCIIAAPALADVAPSPQSEDLSNLTIEQLANIQVRSASKRPQLLSDVPASIYVIDHDAIVRSGAITIPEILRLAPNLQVYQTSSSNWVVTARGLDGLPFAQSTSNKLLVLIDGRTIYTPLFSGVYWDLPDLLPDDIERIEVISGPGATLWGANAVNGVINIITRSAGSTTGAFVQVEAGSEEQVAGLRFAGQAGPAVSYRAYARLLRMDSDSLQGGGLAHDSWHRLGGGFRLDWTPGNHDQLTLQGDIFGGREEQDPPGNGQISGHDLMLKWNSEPGGDQQLQVQALYDHIARGETPSSPSLRIDTYDADVQESLRLGSRNQLVWGGGVRVTSYKINGLPFFFFVPDSRNLFLANAFVQDTFALAKAVNLTAGIKAEHDPYVGWSLLPDVRLAFKPGGSTLLWAAVSHAVRSPTPFDEDVREFAAGNAITLNGNRAFRTEKLTAYEIGVRAQPADGLSFSATGFYHDYDDLRSIEIRPGPGLLNLAWGNGLKGHSYGLEAWASASPVSWWTLSAGATLMHEDFHFKPGELPIIGTFQNGVDPEHQFNLRSSMNLGRSITLDLDFRAVGALKNSDVPAYAELGGRLAWNVSQHLSLALTGANLLHSHHVEYPGSDAISRRVLAGVEWHP